MHNDAFFISLAFLAILIYLAAMRSAVKRFKSWPIRRLLLFAGGVATGVQAFAGPIGMHAHHSFVFHMAGHLLLGMLAPLLVILSRPITLLLRALPQKGARSVMRLFRSGYARFLVHPVTAAVLNIGGLWLLYTTPLYHHMHQVSWVSLLVHFHVFAAGYLFTLAMLYTEPVSYRKSHVYRMVVFIFALAGHGILSKYLYANPPSAVGAAEAQSGAMLMYYGGDFVDLMLIILLCWRWYRATAPGRPLPGKEAAE